MGQSRNATVEVILGQHFTYSWITWVLKQFTGPYMGSFWGFSFLLQTYSNLNPSFTEIAWKEPSGNDEDFPTLQDSRHLLSFREAPVLIVFPAPVLLLFAIKEFISGELTLLFSKGTCSYLGAIVNQNMLSL